MKRVISTVLAVLMIISMLSTFAFAEITSGSCGTNVNWSLNTETGTLTISGTGTMTNYTGSSSIPWYSYKNYIKTVIIENGITSIGNYAFFDCTSLTSVTIGNTVTSIGSSFNGCTSLTSITIPESVTSIGGFAFSKCHSLASVTIPEKVTMIGARAFKECKSLTSITIPDSVKSIGEYAFESCSKLSSVTLGNGISKISNQTFLYCSALKSITVPEGVTTIADYAFCACSSLKSITIPVSVTSIGNYVFNGCISLTDVNYNGSATYFLKISIGSENTYFINASKHFNESAVTGTAGANVSYSLEFDTGTLTLSGTGAMTDYTDSSSVPWCSYRNYIKTIVIENGVTSIGYYAFNGCTLLTSITIPDSVTSIGGSAFNGCTSLKSVTIPDNVKSISGFTFYKCTSLSSVTIGKSVTSIGSYAFYGCTSFTDAYYNGSETDFLKISIGSENTPFNNATKHYSLKVLTGSAGTSVSYSFSTHSGVLTISGTGAMTNYTAGYYVPWYSCKDYINTVIIESGVTSIGNYAFADCKSLTSVTIGNTVTAIGSAFYNCTSLTSVTIPDNVTSIWSYAFAGCAALKSVTIGNGVTSIGNYAFRFCTSLTSITIPDNVKSIGDNAFEGCSNLSSVTLGNGISKINNSTFLSCISLESITIPNSVTTISDNAIYGCSSLKSVIIPDSVTYIGNGAFNNCRSLTDIYYFGSEEDFTNITFGTGNAYFNSATKHYNYSPFITGTAGSNATFTFDPDTAVLTITGTGTLWSPGLEAAKRPLVKEVVAKGLTSISANIFSGAHFTSLEKVTLPDGITSLGAGVFTDCKTLKEINLPSSLTSIGNLAFYNCKALTKIDIPANVTSIGNSAFLGVVASDINYAGTRDSWDEVSVGTDNTRLSFVACSDDVRTILDKATKGDAAWIFNEGRETVYFAGSNAGYIKSYTEANPMIPADIAAKVKYVDIDETMAGFGAYVFANMTNVISVTGGENIRYVGNYAFKGCASLKTVEFTNAAHFGGISYGLFSDCTSLETIEISDSIAYFYGASFQRCTSLKSINVPARAGAVGEYAFRGCTSLETITLLEGVKSFGAGAIQNCSGLKTINFPSTLNAVGAYAFYSVPSTITVNFGGTQAQWNSIYVKTGNEALNYLKVNFK